MIKSTTQLTMTNPFDTITIGLAFCSIIIVGIYQYINLPKKIPILRIKTALQEKFQEDDYDDLNLTDSENGPIWF